jgi:cyclophilin family peptidyl-prolyl cis-trans isomerase
MMMYKAKRRTAVPSGRLLDTKAKKRFLAAFIAAATMFMVTSCAEVGDDTTNRRSGNPAGDGSNDSKPESTFNVINGTLQGSPRGNSEEVELKNGDTYAVINFRGFGSVTLALFPEIAPVAVGSFVELARSGYYEGKLMHRIIPDFMIQGGSPFGDGRGDQSFQGFNTEPSPYATHKYGAISTANTGRPMTNGQQFFIVNRPAGTPHLNGGHTVFGQMVDGFDVLEAISAVATDSNDQPIDDVIINWVVINTYSSDVEREVPRGNARGEISLEEGDTYAVIDIRGFGEIRLVLFPEIAPLAVANFTKLAEDGTYEGRTFHRIIEGFMIQGGCSVGDGTGLPAAPQFATEPSPHAVHVYGAISTANRGGATNGEQFFIVNTEETPWLNGNHTVFGQMVSGFDVLEAVSGVAVQVADPEREECQFTNPATVPVEPVIIENVRVGVHAA